MVLLGEPQPVRSFRLARVAGSGDAQSVRSFRLARSSSRLAAGTGSVGRPLMVEFLVVLEVLALLVAVVLPLVKPNKRATCRTEVAAVRSAVARYQIGLGNENPKNLNTLVGLGLLKAAPAPNGPSVSAGFLYDATHGTYSGGNCAG
jgi:competence protein ComGC